MRMSALSALLAIVLTSLLPSTVPAEHSVSPCASEVIAIGTGAATLYIINDETGIWIYLESNGHAGLQRGGFAWWEIGTGTPQNPCWDRDLATGEEIPDPDFIVL